VPARLTRLAVAAASAAAFLAVTIPSVQAESSCTPPRGQRGCLADAPSTALTTNGLAEPAMGGRSRDLGPRISTELLDLGGPYYTGQFVSLAMVCASWLPPGVYDCYSEVLIGGASVRIDIGQYLPMALEGRFLVRLHTVDALGQPVVKLGTYLVENKELIPSSTATR